MKRRRALIGRVSAEAVALMDPSERSKWGGLLKRLSGGVRCIVGGGFRVADAERERTEWRAMPASALATSIATFRWMQYCRWRVVRKLTRRGEITAAALLDISPWMNEADAVRAGLAAANDPLVRRIVRLKMCWNPYDEDALQCARMKLLDGIDLFDWSLGWQFSTFAFRIISREVHRYRTNEARQTRAMQLDMRFERPRPREEHREALLDLARLLDSPDLPLTAREKHILGRRFGLFGFQRVTLDTIGAELGGLSRERVRQIERDAIDRLRVTLGAEHEYRIAKSSRHSAVRRQPQDQRCGRRRSRRVYTALRLPPADRCG